MSEEKSLPSSREKFTVEKPAKSPLEISNPKSNDDPEDFFGPALPPHLLNKKESERVYGPILPDNLRKSKTSEESSEKQKTTMIGPEIPEHFKPQTSEVESDDDRNITESNNESKMKAVDDSEDDGIGPSVGLMDTGEGTSFYDTLRTANFGRKASPETVVKRESWMTELPETKAAFLGLESRQFRKRNTADESGDRSVWTDTPMDKEKKKKAPEKISVEKMFEIKRLEERDKYLDKIAKKAAKKLKKQKTLLSLHVEKHKKHLKKKKKEEKKKKKEEKKPERRPFDRNIDLQVRRIDESQRRAIINKAQFLNDRFAAGESKFL